MTMSDSDSSSVSSDTSSSSSPIALPGPRPNPFEVQAHKSEEGKAESESADEFNDDGETALPQEEMNRLKAVVVRACQFIEFIAHRPDFVKDALNTARYVLIFSTDFLEFRGTRHETRSLLG